MINANQRTGILFCTMILSGYMKNLCGAYTTTSPFWILCFPLLSKSFHLVTDFKPDTTRGSASERHSSHSYWVRVKTSLRKATAGVWALFSLQGCHHMTQTHSQERETGMSSWKHSSNLLEEMMTAMGPFCPKLWAQCHAFQGSSRFPTETAVENPLQQTTRERMPANGKDVCLKKASKKEGNS